MAQFTLDDAKKLSQSKLTNHVIDEFRKSPLMDAMVFDDCVKPQGGNSLTYVYNRVSTYPTAEGRRSIKNMLRKMWQKRSRSLRT